MNKKLSQLWSTRVRVTFIVRISEHNLCGSLAEMKRDILRRLSIKSDEHLIRYNGRSIRIGGKKGGHDVVAIK